MDKNEKIAAAPSMAGFMPGRPGRGGRNMPVVKPKDLRGSLRRLWGYVRAERRLLFVILAFILADSAVGLAVPYLTGRAVDTMRGAGSVAFSLLGIIAAALLVSYAVDALIVFMQNYLMAGVSQRIVKSLRRTLFRKLQNLPVRFFDTHQHGDLMSRLTNDIDNISSTISQNVVSLMSDVIGIAGSLILMLALNPPLTLAAVITVPLVLILSNTIAKKTRVLFKRQQTVLGTLNGHIEESISGIRVVKAFNHEDASLRDFEALNGELCRVGMKAQVISGFLMPLMNVIGNLSFIAVACFGGVLAVRGLVTVGVIASFLSYSKQFSRPLNDIATIFNTLQTAVAGAERVFEILDEPEEPPDSPDAAALGRVCGNVEFRNVIFGYRPQDTVLNGISFTAEAGSTVALVGPTGAGKTTVVNLINRFYEVTNGKILIDGRNIADCTRESLRRCFGIVLQDTYLFSGTIRENIRYGRPDAGDGAVRAAAETADADRFIRKLPDGYETMLTESGSNLSEGERQLLAIARAVLSDPAILILDEATSSVDTRTELQIQKALIRLRKGRTCFIIAHRLSTIRDADLILVINNGRIMERGTHEQLLRQKGFYYRLCRSQYNNVAI